MEEEEDRSAVGIAGAFFLRVVMYMYINYSFSISPREIQ